jgi:signal transduction histidine kinase
VDDLVFDDVKRLKASTDLQVDGSGVSAGRVLGDREQLERLIRNLTDNAARHAVNQVRLALHEGDATLWWVDDEAGRRRRCARPFERFAR